MKRNFFCGYVGHDGYAAKKGGRPNVSKISHSSKKKLKFMAKSLFLRCIGFGVRSLHTIWHRESSAAAAEPFSGCSTSRLGA